MAEAVAEKATIVMAPFIVKFYLPFEGTIDALARVCFIYLAMESAVDVSTHVALRRYGIDMLRVRPQLKPKTVVTNAVTVLCVANAMWWGSMAMGERAQMEHEVEREADRDGAHRRAVAGEGRRRVAGQLVHRVHAHREVLASGSDE